MLSLAEQLVLTAVGEDGLEATGGSERMRYSLAGAMLLDLHWLGRISLDNEPVQMVDRTPCADPWIATVHAAMLRPHHAASTIVWLHALRQLCPDMPEQGLAALVAKGILAQQQRRMLWAVPYATYRVVDPAARQGIAARLGRAAATGSDADERTQALAALVLTCGCERLLVERRQAERLKLGLANVVASACEVVQAVDRDVREAAQAYEASSQQVPAHVESPLSGFGPI